MPRGTVAHVGRAGGTSIGDGDGERRTCLVCASLWLRQETAEGGVRGAGGSCASIIGPSPINDVEPRAVDRVLPSLDRPPISEPTLSRVVRLGRLTLRVLIILG